MMVFNKNKITAGTDLIGEELKAARLEKDLKIKGVARELKIREEYLLALEKGNFKKLPTGIYGKNFLKEYALFLNLDAERLGAVYDEAMATRHEGKDDLFAKKVPGMKYFLATPKLIKNTLIIAAVIICIGYLAICTKKIVSPPALSLISPGDNLVTSEHSIDIKGITEAEAEIVVNGELVLKNSDGYFEKKIYLKNGLNIISVTAQKKYSPKSSIVKKILVKS